MKIYYFDHAATTAVRDEVLQEMIPYFGLCYGNPSSFYQIGREAKVGMTKARQKVAVAIGCEDKEVYFTSCGSESDNLAIKGFCKANREKGNHIITSKIEHPAVLHTCRALEKEGYRVTYLGVNDEGFISLEELEKAITEETILISIMFANNEVGTIQPIEEIGKIAKRNQIAFHTDAVQAVGNVKIDVKEMGIAMLSMSAHKFYGPKGVGALYIKEGVKVHKIQEGGHQERDKRAGTENVAEIVGLGKAIELITKEQEAYNEKLKNLRDYYLHEVVKRVPDCKINGGFKNRLAGNANVSFLGVDSSDLLLKLDEVGICSSSGSACSSGVDAPSHVLTAMGLEQEEAKGALRISFGRENTKEEVEYLLGNLEKKVKELRA